MNLIRGLACGAVAASLFTMMGCGLYGLGSDATEFVATLSGDAERPDPVETDAMGTGTFALNEDETTLTYSVSAMGLSGDLTGAHFHLSPTGPEGFGNVIEDITASVMEDGQGGVTLEGTWEVTEEEVSNIRLGYIYVNLHTAANPAGEIRGNLVPAP